MVVIWLQCRLQCSGAGASEVHTSSSRLVWLQHTVRSKEDLNPKGVVLLGFLQQQMAKLYIVLVKNIWLWRFM